MQTSGETNHQGFASMSHGLPKSFLDIFPGLSFSSNEEKGVHTTQGSLHILKTSNCAFKLQSCKDSLCLGFIFKPQFFLCDTLSLLIKQLQKNHMLWLLENSMSLLSHSINCTYIYVRVGGNAFINNVELHILYDVSLLIRTMSSLGLGQSRSKDMTFQRQPDKDGCSYCRLQSSGDLQISRQGQLEREETSFKLFKINSLFLTPKPKHENPVSLNDFKCTLQPKNIKNCDLLVS